MLSDIIYDTFLKTHKKPAYLGVRKSITSITIEEDKEFMNIYASSMELEDIVIRLVYAADKMIKSYKRSPI